MCQLNMKLLLLVFCFKLALSVEDLGKPVFLTDYVKKGDFEGARKASLVPPLVENIKSYSGYFTVDDKFDSNLFFWYFPAERYEAHAPVVVWLQGGPGASSMSGLFEENGPLVLNGNGTLSVREWRWSKFANLIFIDNPVGTGFSFTNGGYSTDETMVGNNLDNMMRQFFSVFDHLKNNEFYITGESYAGKYVPAMAYAIHEKNKKSPEKINLKGFAIGNGLCDPVNMLDYGDYLYQIGLIDTSTKLEFIQVQNQVKDQINQEKYLEAFQTFDKLLNGDLTPYKTLFYNATGFNFYFNYLYTKDYSKGGNMGDFFKKENVRKSIHVGNLTFNSGQEVEKNLASDVMKSIKPWFEVLIENYRVLIYNGQLDIIVAYPLTVNFLKTVKWSGSEEYKTAPRNKWYVGTQLAGYSKSVKGFTEVLVRNAGHMVPSDQPQHAYELIYKFVNNKSI